MLIPATLPRRLMNDVRKALPEAMELLRPERRSALALQSWSSSENLRAAVVAGGLAGSRSHLQGGGAAPLRVWAYLRVAIQLARPRAVDIETVIIFLLFGTRSRLIMRGRLPPTIVGERNRGELISNWSSSSSSSG